MCHCFAGYSIFSVSHDLSLPGTGSTSILAKSLPTALGVRSLQFGYSSVLVFQDGNSLQAEAQVHRQDQFMAH